MVLCFMVVVFDFVVVMMVDDKKFGGGGVLPFWSTRERGRKNWFCINSFFVLLLPVWLPPIYINFQANIKEKQVTVINRDQLKTNMTNCDKIETSRHIAIH